MQIHTVLVKKIRENIKERGQAGALVATICTLSTVRVRFWQTAIQTNTKLIHIYIYMFFETQICLLSKYV